MTSQLPSLAEGRWARMPFLEQMANIGSEVERAILWKTKNNPSYSQKALERALDLIDLTLANVKTRSKLKEIARVREALVDFFMGDNLYQSTPSGWQEYFLPFAYAVRRSTGQS